jgi:hypothetical protein
MKRKYLFFIVAFLVLPFRLWAEELSHIPGAFVDIGYGARPMGMGGAFTGLADDQNAVLWNPAGLMQLKGSGVSFMWAKQLGFIPYNYLVYARPLGESQRLGAALIYSGDEVLSETTAIISYASSLKYLGKTFSPFSLALNLKFRWASFGNNPEPDPEKVTGDALGYGLDLGLMWKISDKVSAGMLFRDLYNDINWNSSVSGDYSEAVPSEYTLGVAYRPSVNSIITLDLRKALYRDTEDRLMLGLEQKFFRTICLRAGWGQNVGGHYSNQDIAFGLGLYHSLKRLDFSFDFAYLVNDLKNTPRAGVTLKW